MRSQLHVHSLSWVRSCTSTLYSIFNTYSAITYHNFLSSVEMHKSSLTLLAVGGALQGLLGSSYATSASNLPNILVTDSEPCWTIRDGVGGEFQLYFTKAAIVRDDAHHTLYYTLSHPRALYRQVCYVEAHMECGREATKLGAKQFSVQEGRTNRYTNTAEWTCRIYEKDDPDPELFNTEDKTAKYVWGWTFKDYQ